MDKNQGYSILKAVMLENGRGFALGHHPTAPSPYVTWACYDDEKGQRQYECLGQLLLHFLFQTARSQKAERWTL